MTTRIQPVYSPTQAAAGAFLGGPLASVIFVRYNFRAIGREDGAQKSVIFGTIVLLIFFGTLPILPDRFPNSLIPLITIIATRYVVKKLQFSKQAISDSDQLTFQSNWRVFWIWIASLILSTVAFVALAIGLEYFGIMSFA